MASLCCPEQLNRDLKFQVVSIPSSTPDPSTLSDPKGAFSGRAAVCTSRRQTSSFGHYYEFYVGPDPSPAGRSMYFAPRQAGAGSRRKPGTASVTPEDCTAAGLTRLPGLSREPPPPPPAPAGCAPAPHPAPGRRRGAERGRWRLSQRRSAGLPRAGSRAAPPAPGPALPAHPAPRGGTTDGNCGGLKSGHTPGSILPAPAPKDARGQVCSQLLGFRRRVRLLWK